MSRSSSLLVLMAMGILPMACLPFQDIDFAASPTCDEDGTCRAVEWLRIAGGSFQMGSSTDLPNSRPPHLVSVPSFELMATEVTVAHYRDCVEAGGCAPACDDRLWCNCSVPGRDNFPMTCVTWYQARDYCVWAGGRLPTEAEWEYAARGQGQDVPYPWWDAPPTCDLTVMSEWGVSGCGENRSWEVCNKPDGNTDQGVCDMAGNVWEWIDDDYHDTYEGAPTNGTAWVNETDLGQRVIRGGSYQDSANALQATHREWANPSWSLHNLGFRCSRIP